MPYEPSTGLSAGPPPSPPVDSTIEAIQAWRDAEDAWARAQRHLKATKSLNGWVASNPPQRVVDARGKVWELLGRDTGTTDLTAVAVPWQVTVTEGVATIPGESKLWLEYDDDVTDELVGYDETEGFSSAVITGGYVAFHLTLDASADITGYVLNCFDLSSTGFYVTTGSPARISDIYIPIAKLNALGNVSTQFIHTTPVLIRQNINGMAGYWIA